VTVMRPQPLTVYASAARTATPTANELAAGLAHGLHLVIDVTAVTSTPSVVPTIDGYDALSDKWYNLLTGVAITATGTTRLTLYPGVATIANASASDVLPARFRVVMTHGNANSITYTVAAILVA
jgi:hypothetical protein